MRTSLLSLVKVSMGPMKSSPRTPLYRDGEIFYMARGDVERFWDGDAVIVTPRSSDNRLSAWKQPAVPVLADFCIPESEPLAAKRSRSMEPSFLWLICSFCFCAVMMFGTAALLLYPVA